MFEALVSSILDGYLSPYVENFDSSKLKIGYGAVILQNLKLRTDAFKDMGLPVLIKAGFLGCVKLDIPWMNPVSRPTVVDVSDIYAVVTPQSEFKFDAVKEAEATLKAKLAALFQREKERAEALASKDEKSEKSGYFAKMALQIVHNIQLRIHRVHFLYQDRSSLANQDFEIGFTMRYLAIETSSKKTSSKEEKREGLLFKTLRLEGLGVYVCMVCMFENIYNQLNKNTNNRYVRSGSCTDTTSGPLGDCLSGLVKDASRDSSIPFMIRPIGGTIQLALNDTKTIDRKEHAVIDMDMSLDPLCVEFTKSQFACVLAAADGLSNYKAYCSFRAQYRPKDGSRPSKNPRAWWRYAIMSTRDRVRKNAIRRSWTRVLRLHDSKKEYVPTFASILRKDPSLQTFHDKTKRKKLKELVDVIDRHEKYLEMNEIWHFRKLARTQIDHEEEVKAIKEEMELERKKLEKEEKAATASSGWLGGWFSSKKTKEQEKEENEERRKEIEREKEEKMREASERIAKMENDFKEAENLLEYDPDEVPFWKQMKALDKMATVRVVFFEL